MADSLAALSELRLADVLTVLAVQRRGSISAAARELRVTPSQVSKSVARLESALGAQLLVRSTRGITLSQEGLQILPDLREIVARLGKIGGQASERVVTVAAPSYLNSYFLPRIATCRPALRIRALDLPPAAIRAHASDNVFDLALCIGADPFPPTWRSVSAGEIRKGLFGSPRLVASLGPAPVPVERLAEVPFVSPIYWAAGEAVGVHDDCPLGRPQRRLGAEVPTIALALELAVQVDQLVFGPTLAARRHVESGALVEVEVDGWDVRDGLWVACNVDRLLLPEQQAILGAVREGLLEADSVFPLGGSAPETPRGSLQRSESACARPAAMSETRS